MAYLHSNVPYFKAWIRREYTHNHEKYHGEFLHAMVIGVTTMPNRCLSFLRRSVANPGYEAESMDRDLVAGDRSHKDESEVCLRKTVNRVRLKTPPEP